ncbi:MAG TPA: hypothetical protein VEC11_10340 [Allosphingosinicella sp.]|nr:hypothetical protein [Allosphingosinicella sp.]
MKKLLIAALVAGQTCAATTPAFAQGYAPAHDTEMGMFSGVRIRIPFGGGARAPIRAGLAFAPTARTDYQDGRVRTRIGEGLEFGVNGREPLQFSLAGTPVNRLAQGRAGPDGQRLGVSTIGWIAIGVGATLVILVTATAICMSDSECNPSE